MIIFVQNLQFALNSHTYKTLLNEITLYYFLDKV